MPAPKYSLFDRLWPEASLRTYMVAVILLATLPIAAFVCLDILQEVRAEQAKIEDQLGRSAAALAQAAERDLASSLDALAVLSQSELFQSGRVGSLGRLLQGRPRRDWDSLFLLDPDGQTLLDTGGIHDTGDAAVLAQLQRKVLAAGKPEIHTGARAGKPLVAIALPIAQHGTVRYVLGARMSDAPWQRLVDNANVPQGAHASLLDGRQELIAPWPAAARRLPVGAAQDLREQPQEGVHRAPDFDEALVYAAWHAVPSTDWQARVAVPAGPIDRAHRNAIVTALGASGASLMVGILLAAWVARRVTAPLRQLAEQGPGTAPGRIPVREIALLRDALLQAQQLDERTRSALQGRAEDFEKLVLQLRESQRLTELAQEAGHAGFLHYEFANDRLAFTPGQCKLFGLAQLEQAGLADWFALIADADRDRVEREFWTASALRREAQTLEYGAPQPDGRSRWLSTRLKYHYDADGRASQVTGMTLDVTEQKQLELERSRLTEEALAARRDAETASRAKDEFLTMLSHELRNPLGAISAAIEVLESAEPGAPNAAEARTIIARQTRNLAHMMNDLLDVGRVIAGKILLARQPVNLAIVVRRAEETLAITGQAKGHAVHLDLADAWIDGDAVRIEQVVTNLLTNAIKYTPTGGAIRVSVRHEPPSALLQVRDEGMGIPPDLLPHIFDLFVQGQRTLDRRAGGLGIGLTLVRRLVELHGGTVAVESSEEGSRFTIRLPAIEAPLQLGDDTLAPSRRRKVLVVEDNHDVLAALRSKLELDGHIVSTAGDGIEGLSRLLKLRPEISIVDIGLPGLTGFELARHARAAGYAGRMIALSGYGAERDEHEALVAGFDAYLVKPVDRHQLRASMSAE
jgi:PAS domain S-box-containing protein